MCSIGCGLIEVVFEPDLRSATAASSALKTLQVILGCYIVPCYFITNSDNTSLAGAAAPHRRVWWKHGTGISSVCLVYIYDFRITQPFAVIYRCDVNVSISSSPDTNCPPVKGDRVEIKNVNSFKFLSQAINFEANRQVCIRKRNLNQPWQQPQRWKWWNVES